MAHNVMSMNVHGVNMKLTSANLTQADWRPNTSECVSGPGSQSQRTTTVEKERERFHFFNFQRSKGKCIRGIKTIF